MNNRHGRSDTTTAILEVLKEKPPEDAIKTIKIKPNKMLGARRVSFQQEANEVRIIDREREEREREEREKNKPIAVNNPLAKKSGCNIL